MLTPGYSPTATERVLPRLALDFTTGVLDSRVTVTRALNTATRVNSSGYIETVNADLPRFDYSPTSVGTPRGLLIEESRANLLLQSQDFSTTWSRANANISTNADVSPDGTANADLFIPTGTPATVFQGATKAATSLTYTLSVYVKPSGFTTFRVFVYGTATTNRGDAIFSLVGGGSVTSVISAGTFTNTTASIVSAGNGYYRCTVTTTSNTDTAISTTFRFDGTPSGSSGFLLYGAQLELGAFATSYIPTTTTSLTRNADQVAMTGTNFSSWYTSSSAALAATVIPNTAAGTRPIWQLDDTTANEIIALRGNVANPELYIVDNGTPQAQLDAGTITANTQYGLCAAFTANSCAASQNGATPVTTATATMPTVTQARIGSDGSNFLNGAVRTLRYWPQRILNAETQAFSK